MENKARLRFVSFKNVPKENVLQAVIYLKEGNSCPFYGEIKSLLRTHLPNTELEVINMSLSKNLEKEIRKTYGTQVWPALVLVYDVDGEERHLYVGNEEDLRMLCEVRLGQPILPKEIKGIPVS